MYPKWLSQFSIVAAALEDIYTAACTVGGVYQIPDKFGLLCVAIRRKPRYVTDCTVDASLTQHKERAVQLNQLQK